MKSYDTIDRDLIREYAPVREALTEAGLFEELDTNPEKISTGISHVREILAAKGISQRSIDAVTKTIWLAVHLGVRDRDGATELSAALKEIQEAL